MHRRQIEGVAPLLASGYHLPPHSAILSRMNPRRILYLARLVEIEYEVGRKHVAGIVAYYHRTPRCVERSLYISLHTRSVWREPRLEHHVLVVEIEVHCGEVDAGGFMQIDVESVVGLELQ